MRNLELIKHSINDFVKLRKKNLVIEVIGNKEPIERGYGNINCQMKALEEGLRRVDSQRFVLKTRADIYINSIF